MKGPLNSSSSVVFNCQFRTGDEFLNFHLIKSSLFKTSKIQQKRQTGPQVARANLGRPDVRLFNDKINIITVTTIKDRTK